MDEHKKKRKKTRRFVFLSVLAALAVAAAVIIVLQRNNIEAAKYYLSLSSDEINVKLNEAEQKTVQLFEDKLPVKVRDLTDEEKKLMASDAITMEEAVKILTDDYKRAAGGSPVRTGSVSATNSNAADVISEPVTSENTSDENAGSGPEGGAQTDGAADADDVRDATDVKSTGSGTGVIIKSNSEAGNDELYELAELIAEAYALRAYYTNMLEGMRSSAVKDYTALVKEEQTQAKKRDIGMQYLGKAGALESECDGRMTSLLSRIETELDRTGGDKSIINDIKYYYAEEKSLKKAYYLSLYS